MKDFPKREDNEDFVQIIISTNEDSYDSVSTLVVSSVETQESLVMDSSYSYNMYPMKEYFETLNQEECGLVRLGDNKASKVHGVVMTQVVKLSHNECYIGAE